MNTIFSLLFLCCCFAYRKPVATYSTECKIINQDVGIDSSSLRNVFNIYKDFTRSNNKIDLLKITIREEGRPNTAKRIYMITGDTTKLFSYNLKGSREDEPITDKRKIGQVSSLKSIRHGRYTYFCLNELSNEVSFYLMKNGSEITYKLMIAEGKQQNAIRQEATLAPLFELLNE